MERLQIGGRHVAGFGVGFSDEFEKANDPLYECHHDTYVTLKVLGAVIVTAAATAGVIYYVVPRLTEPHSVKPPASTGSRWNPYIPERS